MIRDGATVSSETSGAGRGGDLTINASRSVELTGTNPNGFPTSLSTATRGSGNAGNLTINTGRLIVRDGAQAASATISPGSGGNLSVNAEQSVEVIGTSANAASGLFASAIVGDGAGGDLRITTPRLIVRDGALLSVSNFQSRNLAPPGTGPAGNLEIQAATIRLENQGVITAAAAGGDKGNITLDSQDIQMRRQSAITTNATGPSAGGNITLNTDTLVALDNSDITANATNSQGGRVIVNAQGIFGTQFRPQLTRESDITASSDLGAEFSGIVEINTPDVDPSSGLVELSTTVVDVESLVAQNLCTPKQAGSSFVISGRGGLPTSPNDPLTDEVVVVEWSQPSTEVSSGGVSHPPSTDSGQRKNRVIRQIQGWFVAADGTVILWDTFDPPKSPLKRETLTPLKRENSKPLSLQERGLERGFPDPVFNPVEPQPPALPEPEPLPSPDELLQPPASPPTTAPPLLPDNIPGTITVERFEVIGSTIFSPEELAAVTAPFTQRPIAFAQLLQVQDAIAELYIQQGYITSGAFIPPQALNNGVVTIEVIEGEVERIEVTGTRRLNSNYVRSRLARATQTPLEVNQLVETLQQLQLNPLVENLSAELAAGSQTGTSRLRVAVEEAPSFSAILRVDNGRSPSVGTVRRQVTLEQGNLFGFGDSLILGYTNTDGSNTLDEASYTIPINARNSTFKLSYSRSSSHVIEVPFNQVDIESNARDYQITYRQPLIDTPTQEFALGLSAVRRESDTSLLGERFRQWNSIVQVTPFVEIGTTWNSSGRANPDPNTLAAAGLGLLWRTGDKLTARFDWGIPLIDLPGSKDTWQENGLSFRLEYKVF